MAKILIVEDNEASREMLAKRLTRKGFEVQVAVDGEQGWHMAQREHFDLIVLDLGLPDIDGWQWAKQARAASRLCEIPILAWTAHVQAANQAAALASGCSAVASKPLDWNRFLEQLNELLVAATSKEVIVQ